MTAQEPASIRYKNPGAMWGTALAIKWGAATKPVILNDGKGQGNNIAVFPSFVQGICAQLDLWRTSRFYRNKKFIDAITIWSGGNNVPDYVALVKQYVPGITKDTILNDAFWQGSMGIPFLKAQARHEAGKEYPVGDAEWLQARNIVFGRELPIVSASDDDDIIPLIRIGDSGAAVSTMQKLLGCAITGVYKGLSETEYALRLFQIRNGLNADGACGPLTWDKLNPEA